MDDGRIDTDEAQALRDALRRMGLARPDETPALVALTGGVSSTIVRADTAAGPVCVKRALARLKVAADWRAPVSRSAAEVGWMRFAAEVVPAAVPRLLGEDATTRAFAMQWLDPARHPVWKAQLRDGLVDLGMAAAVGRAIAQVHAASARKPARAQAFANQAAFDALRLDPYFGESARRHPDRAAALQALIDRTASARIALMHGDVSPKNLLAGPAGPVLLDAECACWGDPAFDLAFCLNHLLLKGCWQPAHRAAYRSAYDALASAYLERVDWEPPAGLQARACELLAGLLLARVDGKSPVEYLVDRPDAQQRVRSIARDLLAHPADTLAALHARWDLAR